MNITEAYKEALKGKYIKRPGCSQIYQLLRIPYVEKGMIVSLMPHVDYLGHCIGSGQRPTGLVLCYPTPVAEIPIADALYEDFEAYTAEELLVYYQVEWDKFKANREAARQRQFDPPSVPLGKPENAQ